MREHFIVDNSTTPDWEVMPLGPVDKEGRKACPRCGVEPKVEDVRERSLTKSNVMSVTCPTCGMSNSVAWGSMDLPPFRQAVAMLADSWNSR